MPIQTSVPNNIRKPDSFHEFDFTSASRGLVPENRLLILIGCMMASGTAVVNTPIQVFRESDADAAFGIGSELALMCRAAFKAAKKYGKSPQIWAVPIADPAGTAQTITFTVTGAPTEADDIVFRIAGREMRAGVAVNDSVTTMAGAMVNAIKKILSDLPVTADNALGVMTATANQTGVNGKDIVAEVVSTPAGVSVAVARPATGAGAADIQPALDAAVDKRYHEWAIANHTAGDISDLKDALDALGAPGVKKWGRAFVAETATLTTGTTEATGSNHEKITVLTAESFPNTPGEIAAQAACVRAAETDPALSFDGVELDLYPPPLPSVYTDSEIEAALAAGATPLTINDTQDGVKIVRLVTTLTTIGSEPFENLLDVSNIESLYYVATQVDAAWKRSFPRAKKNKRTKKRVASVTLGILRQCEELEILQNVEDHKNELQVEDDEVLATRLVAAIPESVVPNLHQLVGKHILFVE